jgi:hypothetical protein
MELLRSNWRNASPPIRVHLYNSLRTYPSNEPYRAHIDKVSIQALYGAIAELAQRPEYIPALREEIKATITEGITVAACDKMVLLDSFLKECQRLHPPAAGMFMSPPVPTRAS